MAKGNYYVNYQNYQNLMLLTSSDTKQTLMHLFLFTNSAQRELVSICISNTDFKLFLMFFQPKYKMSLLNVFIVNSAN